MKNILILMRIQQYVKNLFIFLPIFFGIQITNFPLLMKTTAAFLAFCITASAVYFFNDYFDCEEDRKHPVKKDRPIASGAVSKRMALIVMVSLAVAGLAASFLIDTTILAIMLIYIVINVLYTVLLKHVAIIDVVVIAVGFVLRLFIGSAASGVQLSMWIIIMTFLLALFLAFAKRRDDVLLYLEKGEKARKVVDGYNLEFLNVSMIIMTAVIIISYVMYTISPMILNRNHGDKIYLTVIWVILGVLRYLQQTIVFNKTGSPTKTLFKDHFLQVVLAGWIISFWVLIYL